MGNSKYTSSKRIGIYSTKVTHTTSAAVAHACVSEPPSTTRQVREVHNVATQTAKSSYHCQPSAKKGTFVKVSSQYNIIVPVIIRTAWLNYQLSYVYWSYHYSNITHVMSYLGNEFKNTGLGPQIKWRLKCNKPLAEIRDLHMWELNV